MKLPKVNPEFDAKLLKKLDHASISYLGRDYSQVTNTETNKYLHLDSNGKITSTTVPTCVSHDDFHKMILQIPDHFNAETLDQLSFEGVEANSIHDFVDPNGWHTLS